MELVASCITESEFLMVNIDEVRLENYNGVIKKKSMCLYIISQAFIVASQGHT